jgi:N-acetylglucosamine-6-sulfatase
MIFVSYIPRNQFNMYFLFSVFKVASVILFICSTFAQNDPDKPNIVFILTDDQDVRMGSISHMPHVQTLLLDQGIEFTKHYAHLALCCPSRVTLWTGQHAHNHNVTDVGPPYGGWPKIQDVGLYNKYLPVWLNEEGYNTYYSGKLYNAQSMTNWNREGKYPTGLTESVSLYQDFFTIKCFTICAV